MTEANGGMHVHLRVFIQAIMDERDLRYLQRFDAQEKAVAQALASAALAVNKAEDASQRRFEAVNEFRGQLADQAGNLISRTEVDQRIAAVVEKIEVTNTLVGSAMPRGEAETRFKAQQDKIEDLSKAERFQGGRVAGIDATRALMFSIATTVITLISLVAYIAYHH